MAGLREGRRERKDNCWNTLKKCKGEATEGLEGSEKRTCIDLDLHQSTLKMFLFYFDLYPGKQIKLVLNASDGIPPFF